MFELMLTIIFFVAVLYLILYKKFHQKLSQRFLTRPIFVLPVLMLGIPSSYIIYYWFQLQNYNQSPLHIETFDKLNSPYHPSVLYFPKGWNGYKYWMAETPYSPKCEPYRDRNECPSIHVSNDGIEWTQPRNLMNPIVNFATEGEQNLDYYSDPHLVYKDGKIECWYRLTERHGDEHYRTQVSLRRVISTDGVNWSEEEIISQLNENIDTIGLGNTLVSPALIYSKDKYKMWYVDVEDPTSSHRTVALSTSNDGYTWTKKKQCHMIGKNISPWHIDIQNIDNKYYMIVYDLNTLSFWESQDMINFHYINTILEPSHKIGSFYSNGLYRSCLVRTDQQLSIYFSADDLFNTYIGLMNGDSHGNFAVVSINNNFSSFPQFLYRFYQNRYNKYTFIIKNLYRRFVETT